MIAALTAFAVVSAGATASWASSSELDDDVLAVAAVDEPAEEPAQDLPEDPALDLPDDPAPVEDPAPDLPEDAAPAQEPAQRPPAEEEPPQDPLGPPSPDTTEKRAPPAPFPAGEAASPPIVETANEVPSSEFESPWPGAQYSDDGFEDGTWFHQSAAKEDDWREWQSGGSDNNRDADLGRVYVATSQTGGPTPQAVDDAVVKIAFNRRENNGTVSFRVELNQVTNSGIVPNRTAGDVLFLFNQTGGDIPAVAGAYVWTGSGWRLLSTGLGSFFTSRHSLTISELEINLTALFAAQTGGNVCTGGYVVANIRSATSKDFDAQLKDWVAPIALTTPATCEATVEVTKLVQPWDSDTEAPAAGWTFSASGADEGFGLTSSSTAVTGPDGVAVAGAARSFVLRATSPDHEGRLTVAEDLPDGWTMVSATCGDAETAVDTDDGSFTIFGIEIDDAIACTVVNKAPEPLHAAATLAGAFVRDYRWSIDKSVDMDGDFEKVRPGDGHEFGYTVRVSAEQPADSQFTATGKVTIGNPSSSPRSLEGVEILLGGAPPTSITARGVPVALDASTVIPANSHLRLTVTWEFGPNPGPVSLTMTLPGDGSFTAPDPIEDWESDGRVTMDAPTRYASLDDTFPELAQQWDAIVARLGAAGRDMGALDALDHQGGVDYVYTALRGEDVEPGECGGFDNTATLTVPGSDEVSDDAQSKVCIGSDLDVGKAIVYDIQRTVLWDLRKFVDGETTVPAMMDEDGTLVVDVDYVVQVTPTITDSAWQISGSVTVTNPNPWPVQARLTESPELGESVAGCWFVDPEDEDSREATLDVLLPAAAGEPGDAGDAAELEVEYACQVEGRPDEFGGRNVVVLEWESGEDPEAQDAAWSARGSATATADLADVMPEFSYLNTDITVYDDQTIAGQAVELGTSNWQNGPFEFRYTLRVPGPQIPDTEVTHVNRAWIEEIPGVDDEAEVTVITYDLALRVWISEVWRDGVMVFDRYPDPTHTGPDYAIPHVTFDYDDFDIEVGDLLVHDIHMFNQGTRTARIDELVNHSHVGLDYAGDEWMEMVPGHDNEHWDFSPDGTLLLLWIPDGIVLAPGETFEAHLTLRVTEDALPDDDPDTEHMDHFTFVEISAFSGWVPQEYEPELEPVTPFAAFDVLARPDPVILAAPSFFAPSPAAMSAVVPAVTHDGVAGFWSDSVLDIDSTPDHENGGTDDDNVTLVFHSWEDNEIHENNTSMLWDDDEFDHDNDEDDHDGAIVRVVRTVVPEEPEPTPTPTPTPVLKPTTTPSVPTLVAAPVTPKATPGAPLPRTGAEVVGLLFAAGALVALGVLLLVRRRRTDEG